MSRKSLNVAMGCIGAVALFYAVPHTVAREVSQPGQLHVLMGGGAVISPGYQDFIDDVYDAAGYSDVGGAGWLDLFGGVGIRGDEQVDVILGCDALLNTVDASGGLLDESYANLILVPSIYGQLYLTPDRTVYVNTGLNLPLPVTGSDYFNFQNDGIGVGFNIGVQLDQIFRIEAGYTYLPVKAKATASNPVWVGGRNYNFGGPQIRAMLSF